MRTIDDIMEKLPEARRAKIAARVEQLREFQKKLLCLHDDYARFVDAMPSDESKAMKIHDTLEIVGDVPAQLLPVLFEIALESPKKMKQIMHDLGDLQELIDTKGVPVTINTICDLRQNNASDFDKARAKFHRWS